MIRKIVVNDNIVDFDLGRIELKDSYIQLRPIERNVIHYLVANHNACFSSGELTAQCDGDSVGYIINCISNINKKLDYCFIKNNKGLGYYVSSEDFKIIKSDGNDNAVLCECLSNETFARIIEEACSFDVSLKTIESLRNEKSIDNSVQLLNTLNNEIMELIERIKVLGKLIPEDSDFAISFLNEKLKHRIEKYRIVRVELANKIDCMRECQMKMGSVVYDSGISGLNSDILAEKVIEEDINRLIQELLKYDYLIEMIENSITNTEIHFKDNQKEF